VFHLITGNSLFRNRPAIAGQKARIPRNPTCGIDF